MRLIPWFLSLCCTFGLILPLPAQTPDFEFDRSISRPVLESYLSRAVTHVGLCQSYPEASTPQFDADLLMLKNLGAKFIGRAAYAWKTAPNDADHFRLAAERAALAHKADPQILLQACIFEAIYRDVGRVHIPEWVFFEFRLPPQDRNFRYDAMLYTRGLGDLRDHWEPGGSVPDMSKLETQMWFYYRARSYIDAGFEALHFGQIELMDHNDTHHDHWQGLLYRVRRYAAKAARRHWVLCDAHTHGQDCQGRLLFDFHSYPLRIQERAAKPQEGFLQLNAPTSLYLGSEGGITPSGWRCSNLPYLVELDSWGASAHPGQAHQANWIWGYDEICWFAHQPSDYRDTWLKYAAEWVRSHDRNGWLQMPTRRNLAVGVNGLDMYQANMPSPNVIGFGQEKTIKSIWEGNR